MSYRACATLSHRLVLGESVPAAISRRIGIRFETQPTSGALAS
jgi:hypothetical protein